MRHIKKGLLSFSGLFLSCTLSHACPLNAPKDPTATAEACRQIAIKLDWLSRYQDYEMCTKNLDGVNVYIASQYIRNKKYNDAKALLTTAIYQVNFAIDINCYGQEDMKSLVQSMSCIADSL